MENTEILEELRRGNSRDEKIKALGVMIDNISNIIKADDIEIIGQLVVLLQDNDDFVRIKATEGAEFFKSDEIVDQLVIRLSQDSNYFVRGFAAKALGSIGNIKARDALEKACTDPEGFVVSFAQQSLKTINIKLSFSSKLEMLKQKMKENAKK